ncbi:MAG TPA: DUF4886 domain-containing protein, partial [Roseimicrobium sp.]|nr:DUF4886 domain-containing protein [Roseimicrobium sp.]
KQELLSDKWDFVTIQQASIKSHDLSTYQPFANQLRDYVKQHAPQAELMIHQTWEYRVDDPRFSVKNPKEGEPKTQDEMYQMLTASYKAVAKELGIRRIPVGDAFHLANNDTKWAFKPDTTFNPKTATEPSLPDQTHSLNVGWQWKKAKDGKVTLGMDGHHANVAGEYLGACVFFEILYGESAVGNSYIPKGLSDEDVKYLQETAHKAVVGAEPENSKIACAVPGRSGALLNLKKP